MCAHYESVYGKARLKAHFGVDLPSELARRDVWPGYPSTFIRRNPYADVGDSALTEREALLGSLGLIPHWSKDTKIARHTYNARCEIVAENPASVMPDEKPSTASSRRNPSLNLTGAAATPAATPWA